MKGTSEFRPYDVAVDAIRENRLVHTSQRKPWRGHRGPTAYLSECLETGRGLCMQRSCAQTREQRACTTKITEEILLNHQDHHRRFHSLCRTRPTSRLFFKPPTRSMMSRLLVYVRRLLSPFCISSSFFLSMCWQSRKFNERCPQISAMAQGAEVHRAALKQNTFIILLLLSVEWTIPSDLPSLPGGLINCKSLCCQTLVFHRVCMYGPPTSEACFSNPWAITQALSGKISAKCCLFLLGFWEPGLWLPQLKNSNTILHNVSWLLLQYGSLA